MVDGLKDMREKLENVTPFALRCGVYVLGNEACLETRFPSSASRKWLKNFGRHDHRES
jgi:hypothetical protein